MDTAEFRVAALEAELQTGRREQTQAKAKASVIRRLARMSLGTVVTLLGIAMLPLPGPGLPVLAGGLAILSIDVAWADRLLTKLRHHTPGIPADGKIPRSTIIVGVFMTLAATAAAIGLMQLR